MDQTSSCQCAYSDVHSCPHLSPLYDATLVALLVHRPPPLPSPSPQAPRPQPPLNTLYTAPSKMYGRARTRPSAASSLVISLFVVAVLFLAYLHEPFLLSSVQQYMFAPVATQQKGKNKFREYLHPVTVCCEPPLSTSSTTAFPNFNKYIHTHTLPPEAFGIGACFERPFLRSELIPVLTTFNSHYRGTRRAGPSHRRHAWDEPVTPVSTRNLWLHVRRRI